MTIIEIENSLNTLISNFNKETFVFDLLLSYGTPKSTIKRLIGSDHDKLTSHGELIVRKKLFFKVANENLHSMIDELKTQKEVTKHSPRFIIVTDFETLLAYDTKTSDTLDTELLNIVNHYDFFLPLAGMEKANFQDENPADVRASLKMAKLYDELQKNNHFESKEDIHSLNVFLTRLLFCYFAEDTNIFPDNIFTSSISSHTLLDGSDVDSYMERLFKIFNTPQDKREKNTPEYLQKFPYVNGGLFRDVVKVPTFTTKSRNILIEIGQLQWSQINPDIFGSMIQAVVTPDHRGNMGMHYTSVPNIMKVIEPLFLDELYLEFEKAYENKSKLQSLLNRLTKIKIFDPACGSGNFLIIAYKKLREFEMSILKRIDVLSGQMSFAFSEIKLTQFYGIELDDFAHEVAILSLWLAEHQMNLEFYKAFGRTSPSLPLQNGGNIIHGNATRINWEEVCPKNEGDEIYILGNPPYQGSRKQNKEQKEDLAFVFDGFKKFKDLDYIACWFYIGAKYIQNINAKLALVSTNSICQGEQVSLIWPAIFKLNIEIFFAYHSFKWKNNAKDNAGVSVIIVGLNNKSNHKKFLFIDSIKKEAQSINAYLIIDKSNTIIQSANSPIANLPKMNHGNMPADGGKLLFTTEEKEKFIELEPESKKWFRKLITVQEYLNGRDRWCLWLEDITEREIESMPILSKRIEEVRQIRLTSSRPHLSEIPHLFAQITQPNGETLVIVPRVSSENREYIPIAFLDGTSNKVTDSFFTIVTSEIFVFGVVTSKMHMLWLATVGGRLETRFQYSKNVVYNTFPFPNISQKQKDIITELVFAILDEREKHSQKTLAQLYDPDKMPEGLKKAHHNLDIAIEQCYRSKPFESDEERLEYLFKMYEEMTSKEGKK